MSINKKMTTREKIEYLQAEERAREILNKMPNVAQVIITNKKNDETYRITQMRVR